MKHSRHSPFVIAGLALAAVILAVATTATAGAHGATSVRAAAARAGSEAHDARPDGAVRAQTRPPSSSVPAASGGSAE
jgi:hypothetical protein